MDVSVAIIQLRQSALSDRTTLNAADYDVLLVGAALQPSTSTHRHIIVGDDKVTVPQPLRQLPRCHVPADCDPSEMVLRLIRRLTTNRHHHQMVLRRAIRVGLWNGGRGDDGERYSHTSQVFFGQKYHGGTLYCVPMLEIGKLLLSLIVFILVFPPSSDKYFGGLVGSGCWVKIDDYGHHMVMAIPVVIQHH
jgi:hypothetical protein